VQRSRILRAHHVDLEPSAWEDARQDGFATLDRPLAEALRALNVQPRRASVRVTYRAESAIAEVFASPASPRAAIDAARLALEAAAPFPLHDNAFALAHLHRDAAGDAPQSHTLAVADTSTTLCALSEWLARAGLTLESSAPAIAHTIRHALDLALAQPTEHTSAVLLLSEHDAVFLAASPASATLHFVRQIPVGLETFLAPLTRTIARAAPRTPLTLTREQARRYLLNTGIPPHDAEPDAETTLAPRETLPLLQPALQRLAVEIKQSLRFGLSDDTRDKAILCVAGLATSIPNLESRLAELAGASIKPLAHPDERFNDPVARVLAAPLPDFALRTPEAGARVASRRLAQALYAGSAAASLLLLADAAITDHAVTNARLRLDIASEQASSIVLPDAAPEARELADAVALAVRDISEADAARPDWPAFLAELSRRLPKGVRVLAFSGSAEEEIVANVETAVIDAAPSRSPLRDTIASLQSCPLVRQIDLGPTLRDPETGQLRVTLHVALWPAPRAPLAAVAPSP